MQIIFLSLPFSNRGRVEETLIAGWEKKKKLWFDVRLRGCGRTAGHPLASSRALKYCALIIAGCSGTTPNDERINCRHGILVDSHSLAESVKHLSRL